MSKIKTHVKKGDKVEVISGYHKGKQGDILTINATKGQVLVQGVRMIKKATKPSEQNPEGGILEVEGPIHISNVKKI